MLKQTIAKILAWALTFVGPKQAASLSSVIVIGGKKVPIEDVQSIVAAVVVALQLAGQGKKQEDIIQEIEPAFISVAEDVASLLIPYGGTAVALAVWAIKHARPMTFDEEQAWMKRASDAAINSGG